MKNVSLDTDMNAYFLGKKLYGDDFSVEQLKKWYEEEAEGYSCLIQNTQSSESSYSYVYHELNKMHGFRKERLPRECKALGVGSAYCEEFLPILSNLAHITALDPSDEFSISNLKDVPVSHVRPSIEGKMSFEDNHFDIITCFGVLHHIANVSFVLKECYRVLKPGGVMFCREPIVSMGDWRLPRRGATKNERGIPYDLFIESIKQCGFEISHKTLFDFAPLGRLLSVFGLATFMHKTTTILDYLLSYAFAFNKKYHRVATLEKFGPASLYLVLHKKPFFSGLEII